MRGCVAKQWYHHYYLHIGCTRYSFVLDVSKAGDKAVAVSFATQLRDTADETIGSVGAANFEAAMDTFVGTSAGQFVIGADTFSITAAEVATPIATSSAATTTASCQDRAGVSCGTITQSDCDDVTTGPAIRKSCPATCNLCGGSSGSGSGSNDDDDESGIAPSLPHPPLSNDDAAAADDDDADAP